LHCAGEVQVLHAAPFVPHAELEVPTMHVPAEQHPLGHVIDPQPRRAPSVPVTLTEPAGIVAVSTITYTVTVEPVVLFQPVVSATPVPPAFTPATQVRESHAATLVARLSEMSRPLTGVAVTVRLRLFGIVYATTKSGPVDGV
jgi:hypothetical protein